MANMLGMDTDIHALIRSFLQQQKIISLVEEYPLTPDSYTKAGVVPFQRKQDFSYYVMKPRGEVPELGAPLYQLCKGTRQQLLEKKGWRDIRETQRDAGAVDKETLAETALREGIEELGLKLQNIEQLFDLGGFEFSSATTGRSKFMWLFAALVKDADDFLPDAEVATTTETRRWLHATEFGVAGRQDHQYILTEIEAKLARHFHK